MELNAWLVENVTPLTIGVYGVIGLAVALIIFGLFVHFADNDSPMRVVALACLAIGAGVVWPVTVVVAIVVGFFMLMAAA